MYILAVETTGAKGSVALGKKDETGNLSVRELVGDTPMNHMSTLAPMISQLIKEAGVPWSALDAVAVSAGPGSFTGIRIGVATGRAVAQMSRVPLVAVETLPAFGIYGITQWQDDSGGATVACPVLNARRNRVYAGAYMGGREEIAAGVYMIDEFLGNLPRADNFVFGGDGIDAYGEAIEIWGREQKMAVELSRVYQSATAVAKRAAYMLERPEAFCGKVNLTYDQLLPEYMRQAEAQVKLEEALKKQEEAWEAKK